MSTESQKLRAYSARYGARHPLLAPWPRTAAYLAWRALISSLRPVIFLMLVAVAVWLALCVSAQVLAPPATALPPEARIQAAFQYAAPDRPDRRAVWLERLEQALTAPSRSLPDLDLAHSYAQAALDIEGRHALALAQLSVGRSAAAVEADLRARPAMERTQLTAQSLDALIADGRAAGLEPPELILAPPSLRARLDRARALFGPAIGEAQTWFVDPGGRALALGALPGLGAPQAVFYGDERDVLVHACAMADQAGLGIGQCRVGFLPKPRPDPILAGLSAAVLSAPADQQAGARIVKTAWAAGLLDPALAERLAFGPDASLGREALLAALTPVLSQAGDAWSQPVRYRDALADAGAEAVRAGRVNLQDRSAVFTAAGDLRQNAGAFASVRVLRHLRLPEDAARLAELGRAAGLRLAALDGLDPGALADLLDGARRAGPVAALEDWPEPARIQAGLSVAALLGAASLLGLSLWAGYRRGRGGPPGLLERLDGVMTRLILGKNF